MKTLLLVIALAGVAFCASAQNSTNQPARFKAKVISYEGKEGSGVSSSATDGVPNEPGSVQTDTVTSPGHESELKWWFVGRDGGKDVYHFTFKRMAKSGSTNQTTSATDVSFAGKKIIVFQDDLHCVVMETPAEDDLKPARGH